VVEKVEVITDKRTSLSMRSLDKHLYKEDSGIAQRRSLSRALYDTN